MRFTSKGQCRRAMVWLLGATMLLPFTAVSVAQDRPAQVDTQTASSTDEQLQYTLVVVEVPTAKAEAIVDKWKQMGGSKSTVQKTNSDWSLKKAVMPASSTTTITNFEIRRSEALSDEQVEKLVGLGKVIKSRELVGQSGAEVHTRVGSDVACVVSYEPAKDESGNSTGSMQPVVVNIPEGLTLDLTGTFDSQKENVDLKFKVAHAHISGMEHFTFDTEDGPRTVQQPLLESHSITNTCKAPVNQTIAFSSGPIVRESVSVRAVPVIGRLPYIGKFTEYTSKSKESITTIILVRCQAATNPTLAAGRK